MADIVPLWRWGEENRELWSDLKTKWYPKSTLKDWIQNPRDDILLVAKNAKSQPIGMCMVYALRGWGYCSGLFVDKANRGKGIGTSLMNEAMRQLVKHRIYHFSFMVDSRNAKALKLYKRLGFKRGFDSICMYKSLRK